jgi:hypothetical protein
MNKSNFFEKRGPWDPICSYARKLFLGLIALSSEQFALLASSQGLWAYRRIWRAGFFALRFKKGEYSRNKLAATQQHQIMIGEMTGRFVRSFSSFNQFRKDTKAGEILPSEMEVEPAGSHVSEGDADGRNYVVTLLDEADHSILVQFVTATRGIDAANYALRFDEAGAARQYGYKIISVFSSKDIERLKSELDGFGGKAIGPIDSDEDDAILPGAFISD